MEAATHPRPAGDAPKRLSHLRLRECRRDKGLSIDEAAVEIGVSRGTLQRAEQGTTEPQPRTAKKIADFYDQKPSDFWPQETLA